MSSNAPPASSLKIALGRIGILQASEVDLNELDLAKFSRTDQFFDFVINRHVIKRKAFRQDDAFSFANASSSSNSLALTVSDFSQNVLARFERFLDESVMRIVGRCHVDDVDVFVCDHVIRIDVGMLDVFSLTNSVKCASFGLAAA